ncbi:Transmembrane protein 194 [Macleaya cordata]|uniref:Transmembrane protein 194 n=1 Tax=Macleaya cordata TaxID=56857 RepID=A0A200Q5Z5_MACCD|nr:Transmembrane protein 194 [Macleaya cordata]
METSKFARFSGLFLPAISLFLILCCFVVSAADDFSIVVSQPTTLQLSFGLPVENSPGSKPGTVMVCQRVQVRGLSRLHNLRKYAHSVKVKVRVSDSSSRSNIDVCFHRNTSLGIGMCDQRQWEKLIKGSWNRSMSPYDNVLLDIRMPGRHFTNVEVSVEEEFFLYRIVFLVLGIVLLTLAPALSNCIIFYYSGAMTVGIILVVLMVLFQGMRLLPTGRKSSLAIFVYSSLVGMGSFLLRYLPGLLKSVLVEIGISEDLYNPLVMILLVCIILAGAWLGFWVVRKLVLTEDGSIDSSTAVFVAWSIRILSAVLIIQSSLDPLLAAEALLFGILVSSIMRRITKLRFLRRMHKHLFRTTKNSRRRSQIQDSPSEDSHDEYLYKLQRSEDLMSLRRRTGAFTPNTCSSPVTVNRTRLAKTPPSSQLSDKGTYFSTFHKTPERKKFSKEEWESFTRDSTKKALEGLVSSPDFNKWAVANAERITLTPTKDHSGNSERRQRWFDTNVHFFGSGKAGFKPLGLICPQLIAPATSVE